MKKVLKVILWLVIILIALAGVSYSVYNYYLSQTEETVHPVVTFELQDYGTVKMELYPEYAPNTVANIIKLVENGYYTNKVIYGKDEICLYVGRNSEGEAENPKLSLIDSSIEEDSDDDYEYSISGEFINNGFEKNTLAHEKGVVSLIRDDYTQYFSSLTDESYNSGNSQIGIMMSDDSRTLNGVYAAFGRITEGLDILETIYNDLEIVEDEEESSTTAEVQEFATYPVITSASVDTFGNDYGMPETEEAFDYSSYISNYLTTYYSGN